MKLSIVVPCYNIESYIKQFEDNIRNQTLDKEQYEVIFVDDLSTDKGYEKLKALIQEDQVTNYKLYQLSQKGGAGGARNFGLEKSSGDYLIFVDMDDQIAPDFFEKMLREIMNKDADIVICEYYGVKSDGRKIYYELKQYASGEKDYILQGPMPWNKIFNRQFLLSSGIKFQEHVRHQDLGTITKWLFLASKKVYLLEPLYFYQIEQPGSITVKTSQFTEDIYIILSELQDFFAEHDPKKAEKLVYSHLVTRHLQYANHNFRECLQYHQYIINYVKKAYPEFPKSAQFKEQDTVIKIAFLLNYYSKGILSTVLFRMLKILKIDVI